MSPTVYETVRLKIRRNSSLSPFFSHRLSWHFRCSHVRKTSSFFFFPFIFLSFLFFQLWWRTLFPASTAWQFIQSNSRCQLQLRICILEKGFARQPWNISVHREKIFIKDIKVNNNPLSVSFLSQISITNSLCSVSLACLNKYHLDFFFIIFFTKEIKFFSPNKTRD